MRSIHAKGDVLPILAHGGTWKRPHWIEVFEPHSFQVIEDGLSHEAQYRLACPYCFWILPLDKELFDGLWLFDEDLPLWSVVFEIHLEDLHQGLGLRCIFPIPRPNYNHHRLFEQPLDSIEDPCGSFIQIGGNGRSGSCLPL